MLAISPSLTVAFGDLTPNTTKVARWLMISSLQGEFMNYSATFENINPLGDPRLSLLDQLEIHELIRNVMIYSDPSENDEVLDFLVNERDDFLAYPDILYSSKTLQSYDVTAGTILSVNTISGIPTLLEIRSISNSTGWVYYRYEDTQGLLSGTAVAVNITKYEDGVATSIPPENSWITRQTYRGARTTENLYLHIVDSVATVDEVVFVADLCRVDCYRAIITPPTQAATSTKSTPPATPTQATVSTTDSTKHDTPTQAATTTSIADLTATATSIQEVSTIFTSVTDSTTPTQAATMTMTTLDTATADVQTLPDTTTLTTGQRATTATTMLSTEEVTSAASTSTQSTVTDTETTSVDTSATNFTPPTLTTTVTVDINDITPPSTADMAMASSQPTLPTTTVATEIPTSTGMPCVKSTTVNISVLEHVC